MASENRTPQEKSNVPENRELTAEQREALLAILEERFEKHANRHPEISWAEVLARLEHLPHALWSLYQMEETGGEPDVVALPQSKQKYEDEYFFIDCSPESPKGRRSLCYDEPALEARKEHKPQGSAFGMAEFIGVEILTEELYRSLQEIEELDQKTSSWVVTPQAIRERGGALFCERRYGAVFTFHNGAESYYAARGFRGLVRV